MINNILNKFQFISCIVCGLKGKRAGPRTGAQATREELPDPVDGTSTYCLAFAETSGALSIIGDVQHDVTVNPRSGEWEHRGDTEEEP